MAVLGALATALLASLFAFRPARMVFHYLFHGGPLMAAGLSYNLLFASTALLVLGFSGLGVLLGSNNEARSSVVALVEQSVPGLLSTSGTQRGLISVSALENAAPFTATSLVASAALVFLAWRWVAGVRLGCRRMFGLPPAPGLPAAAVPHDLLGLLVLGVMVLVSAVATTAGSGLLRAGLDRADELPWVQDWQWLGSAATDLASTVAVVLVDLVIAAVLLRWVAQLRLRRAAWAVFLGVYVVGNTLLRWVGGELIARTTDNPYLLSFTLLIGVLVWFYLYSQVLLLSAACAAVVQADLNGGSPAPEAEPRTVEVRPRDRPDAP